MLKSIVFWSAGIFLLCSPYFLGHSSLKFISLLRNGLAPAAPGSSDAAPSVSSSSLFFLFLEGVGVPTSTASSDQILKNSFSWDSAQFVATSRRCSRSACDAFLNCLPPSSAAVSTNLVTSLFLSFNFGIQNLQSRASTLAGARCGIAGILLKLSVRVQASLPVWHASKHPVICYPHEDLALPHGC